MAGERASDCEAHIHQAHWWEIRRLCVEGGRTYRWRSAACHGILTEGEAIHPDRAAEVLLKGMSSEKHFSLPERQKYFLASSPLAIVPTLLL